MKLAFLILLNLVTAVGGHFFNRRWDKAFLLFMGMLLVLSLPWLHLLTASTGFYDLMPVRHYSYIQLAIILCFSLLSASLFVIDYRKPGEVTRTKWTRTMTVAAGAFCLVSTFYIGGFGYSYLVSAQLLESGFSPVTEKHEDDSPRLSFSGDSFFNEYIYFAFDGRNVRESMPAPPSGDAVLYGTITRNAAPVAGIKLDVVLGGGFKAGSLVTDADGRFSFPVRPGTWNVNAILVSAWSDKPKGEYVIVTGRESQAGEDLYHKNRYEAGDLTIDAKSGESTAIVALEIYPAVKIISPASNRVKPVEDASGLTIEWEKNDHAAFYIVSLSKVTEEGTITSFHPISQLRTEALSMDLSGFTVFDDPAEINTYSVNLNAFDHEGNFVSESKHMGRHMFTLSGFKVAGDEVISELDGEVSEENYEEFYQNNKKIAAVETLLENQLVAEAENLVALITENSRAGKIDALKGYILAIQGDCENAKLHFDKAIKEGGIGCLPKKYRQNCL